MGRASELNRAWSWRRFRWCCRASGHPVIALRSNLRVILAAQSIDFRNSVHALWALTSEALRANPYCGDVFVFRSNRMHRVKRVAWDGSGMLLVTKWLNEGALFGRRSAKA